MLTSIRIQNFRSIGDASVKLGKVNLFIGPNNSGKSNFLKGIALMAFSTKEYPDNTLSIEDMSSMLPRTLKDKDFNNRIRVVVQEDEDKDNVISLIIGYDFQLSNEEVYIFSTEISVMPKLQQDHKFTGIYDYIADEMYIPKEIWKLKTEISNTVIYKMEPASFNLSADLSHQPKIFARGSNIVNFLYNLSQNHKSNYKKLESDFADCVGNLTSISTPADPNKPGKLKLKFFDQNDIGYWAEEVSEGVLYFLAILCIVHQPDPPKLLLLEEPEKGIHPRRIKEVMKFIFELAELRDVQIIITSHSPYVVDHFADTPENISVFDRENGETVIRNALYDIIEPANARNAEKNLPPIHYTDALGEHWVSGFLGGVPL